MSPERKTYTPQEFWDLCDGHRWYYTMNNDLNKMPDGLGEDLFLFKITRDQPELSLMFAAFAAHKFLGGVGYSPKPKRPE